MKIVTKSARSSSLYPCHMSVTKWLGGWAKRQQIQSLLPLQQHLLSRWGPWVNVCECSFLCIENSYKRGATLSCTMIVLFFSRLLCPLNNIDKPTATKFETLKGLDKSVSTSQYYSMRMVLKPWVVCGAISGMQGRQQLLFVGRDSLLTWASSDLSPIHRDWCSPLSRDCTLPKPSPELGHIFAQPRLGNSR